MLHGTTVLLDGRKKATRTLAEATGRDCRAFPVSLKLTTDQFSAESVDLRLLSQLARHSSVIHGLEPTPELETIGESNYETKARSDICSVTVVLALALVTGASLGKGGGGRGGGHGGGHGGHGGGHFAGHGGGHHASVHFGGHHGHYAGGHYGGHHGHYAAGNHLGGRGNRFAGAHQFRGKGGATRNAFGHQAAWNNWAGGGGWGGWGGGWGGWGGWVGPVFWPFLLGDILSYVLWPDDYYYPFWSYGTFPGYYYGGYAPAYDYSYRYGYGSGGLSDIYGYNGGGYSRHASRTSHTRKP